MDQFAPALAAGPPDAEPADLARIDSLTGLTNRRGFQERLATMFAAGLAPDLLLVDLDRFKHVNDSHGHPVGDALLCVVAKRLRGALRETDLVTRLGGDEFAVLLLAAPGRVTVDGPSEEARAMAAEATAHRLVDVLGRPYLVQGRQCNIGASIGIALAPRDGDSEAALVRNADLALYQAKNEGRRRACRFDPVMDERARARQSMEADLRRALVLGQFELDYQAQINLATRSLVGFEALLRWRHPVRGLVSPSDFIGLSEEIGLIVPIGEWVLRTATREAAGWGRSLTVAVNVSAIQLDEPERLIRAVQSALRASGLPGERLEIEITESAVMRREAETRALLHRLRALGVRVSMDDFGTGYSSLSQLRSFPFDKIKIDRSFVKDLGDNAEAVAVVRAIAALGASLGMTTTAEGVETLDQAEIVHADGCTDMQGFLVSRPVPPNELAQLIDRLMPAEAATTGAMGG